MSEDLNLKPGTTIDHRFTLVRRIGRGGFGAVWAADDANSGRQVAVKLLHPHLRKQPRVFRLFEKEAKALFALQHPGIVRPIAFSLEDPTPYLAMELVQGFALHLALAEAARVRGYLDAREVETIFASLCDTIAHAHERGIVHRDMKPNNVLIERTPMSLNVKVLDFGIARFLETPASDGTTVGRKMGSVCYMSPEQSRGDPATTASDQFALGVILFELLTSHRPFLVDEGGRPALAYKPPVTNPRNAVPAIFDRVNQGKRPKPSDVRDGLPLEFDTVVLRAMSVAAGDRFTSVREMFAATKPLFRELRDTGSLSVVNVDPTKVDGSTFEGREGTVAFGSSGATPANVKSVKYTPEAMVAATSLNTDEPGIIEGRPGSTIAMGDTDSDSSQPMKWTAPDSRPHPVGHSVGNVSRDAIAAPKETKQFGLVHLVLASVFGSSITLFTAMTLTGGSRTIVPAAQEAPIPATVSPVPVVTARPNAQVPEPANPTPPPTLDAGVIKNETKVPTPKEAATKAAQPAEKTPASDDVQTLLSRLESNPSDTDLRTRLRDLLSSRARASLTDPALSAFLNRVDLATELGNPEELRRLAAELRKGP